MPALSVGIAIGVASVGAWFVVFAWILLATRPERPPTAPSTQDLGSDPESPAVVNLLVNSWKLNEDAAEATLLDLAGRRYFEFRQLDADPRSTTVHLTQAPPSGLKEYERMLHDRVVSLSTGGVVPLPALRFRDPRAATRFQSRIRASVISEARDLGLSQRRLGAKAMVLLSTLAVLASVGVALAVLIGGQIRQLDDLRAVGGAGLVTFVALNSVMARGYGERHTDRGLAVASHWRGVRQWLIDTEAFGELPPAAVAVWDRYLAYGAAVGASRVASEVIDLGLTNRRKIWSSYGGAWRVVRVRYPRLWPRYGQTVPTLILRGGIALVIAYGLFRATGFVNELDDLPRAGLVVAALTGLLIALAGYGLYAISRALIDLTTTRSISGEVLWKQRVSDSSDSPANLYLAVDDGTTDRTTAWILPANQSSRCMVHDIVELGARPWSRRVVSVEVTRPGLNRQSPVSADRERSATYSSGKGPAAVGLLTTDEVARALGSSITGATCTTTGPNLSLDTFTDGNGETVLVSMVGSGLMASMSVQVYRRIGTPVAGVGDEAWVGDDWAMARKGQAVVSLRLRGPAEKRNEHLPWLLSQAVNRGAPSQA